MGRENTDIKISQHPEVFEFEDKETIEKRLLERAGLDESLTKADPARAIVSALAMELSGFKSYANRIALTQFRKWHNERAPKRFGYGEDYENRITKDFLSERPYKPSAKNEKIVEAKIVRAIDALNDDENKEDSYGKLIIFVRSEQKDGVCSKLIIQAMQDFINKDENKIKTDTIIVRSVKPVPFSLDATINLYPTSPPSDVDKIESWFLEAFDSKRKIGESVEQSWLYSVLHGAGAGLSGVRSVDLSKTIIPKLGPGECLFLEKCSIVPGSYKVG